MSEPKKKKVVTVWTRGKKPQVVDADSIKKVETTPKTSSGNKGNKDK